MKKNMFQILMGISKTNATEINVSYDEGREIVNRVFQSAVLFDKITVLENIKSGELIPELDFTPSLKAKSCGYSDDQTLRLTDVAMTTKALGADLTLCEKTLAGTTFERYLQPGMSLEDNAKQALINYLTAKYAAAVQDMCLTGTSGTNSIDGLITKAYASGSGIQEATGTAPTIADALDKLFALYEKIPAAALSSSKKPIIMVGTDWLKKASIQAYNDNRYFGYVVIDEDNGFTLPTTNVRVQGFDALIGTNKALAGAGVNMFVGTDMQSGFNTLLAWWSEDNLEYRTSFRIILGTALAFIGDMVKYTVQSN